MSALRMQMAAVQAPPPPGWAPPKPSWWTANDAADVHSALRGCPTPEANCLYYRTDRCPAGLRRCRTCGAWASDDGIDGYCLVARQPADSRDDCTRWRART